MTARGFTLVELLVAMVITLVIAAGAVVLGDAARAALVVEPASMDTVGRVRDAVDVLSAAVSSAGGERGNGDDAASLANGMPVLQLTNRSGDTFAGIVVTRAVRGGRGRLAADQDGPGGSLTLSDAVGECPALDAVCGFTVGDIGVVLDGRGRFDVFQVGAVNEALGRLVPREPLGAAYRTGSWVVEVRHERFELVTQPDGAHTLTRVTAAGAREPMVDGIVRLEFAAWGHASPPTLYDGSARAGVAEYGLLPVAAHVGDPDGVFVPGTHCMVTRAAGALRSTLAPRPDTGEGLTPLRPADLDDGPWCPQDDAPTRYDADWLRVRRIDVAIALEAVVPDLRGPVGRLFARGGTAAHAARRWVRDRHLQVSLVVGR
jgi:prepilin-type N-terminal cleavage/methylation domain-containing protein